MEPWREAWRKGIAPCLKQIELEALRKALQADDPRLIQGATSAPPALMTVADWPAEAACLIGFCAMATGRKTVGEVDRFFQLTIYESDRRDPLAAECFLNWYDGTPREQMIALMLPEVEFAIMEREGVVHEKV